MDEPPPNTTLPQDYTQLQTAPDHITSMLYGLIKLQPCRHPEQHRCDTSEMQHAREVANRIWAEAAHAGAVWAMQRQPTKIEITNLDGTDLGSRIEHILKTDSAKGRPQ